MEWYEKFKVGQEVRVVKKVDKWDYNDVGASWNTVGMDKTIGKVYEIIDIDKYSGYRLYTQLSVPCSTTLWNFYYPVESLEGVNVKGQQLVFEFMKG